MLGRTPNWSFEALKTLHGSREGFHGSEASNWWCISHKGLKNHSNTRHQRHGSVFGEGVYLATDVAVSRTFAVRGSERPKVHKPCPLARATSSDENNINDKHSGSLSAAADTANGSGGRQQRPEFPFECVARCEVIDLAANVAPRPGLNSGSSSSSSHGGGGSTTGSMRSSSSSDGSENGDSDYLVVEDEGHVHLRSILFFRSDRLTAAASVGSRRKEEIGSMSNSASSSSVHQNRDLRRRETSAARVQNTARGDIQEVDSQTTGGAFNVALAMRRGGLILVAGLSLLALVSFVTGEAPGVPFLTAAFLALCVCYCLCLC